MKTGKERILVYAASVITALIVVIGGVAAGSLKSYSANKMGKLNLEAKAYDAGNYGDVDGGFFQEAYAYNLVMFGLYPQESVDEVVSNEMLNGFATADEIKDYVNVQVPVEGSAVYSIYSESDGRVNGIYDFSFYKTAEDAIYMYEPIEWRVAYSDEEETILVSKWALDYLPTDNIDDINGWLNYDFKNMAFTEKEQEAISGYIRVLDYNTLTDESRGFNPDKNFNHQSKSFFFPVSHYAQYKSEKAGHAYDSNHSRTYFSQDLSLRVLSKYGYSNHFSNVAPDGNYAYLVPVVTLDTSMLSKDIIRNLPSTNGNYDRYGNEYKFMASKYPRDPEMKFISLKVQVDGKESDRHVFSRNFELDDQIRNSDSFSPYLTCECMQYSVPTSGIEVPTEKFAGWYTGKNADILIDISTVISLTGEFKKKIVDDVLVAKFDTVRKIEYYVDGKEHSVNVDLSYLTYTSGNSNFRNWKSRYYYMASWPTTEDGEFDGWYTDPQLTDKIEDIPKGIEYSKEPYKLYGTFKYNKHNINYVLDGGVNNVNNPATYTIKDFVELSTPSKDGYAFEGWYTDEEFKNRIYAIGKGSKEDYTLYAKWSLASYEIKYELNGGVNNSENPKTYKSGETLMLKAPSRAGYVFKGWFTDKELTREIKSIEKGTTGNLTVYAKWVRAAHNEKVTVGKNTYDVSFAEGNIPKEAKLTKTTDKKSTSVKVDKVTVNGKSVYVTEIGKNVFKNNKKIKTVTIGKQVATIGDNAFNGCSALKTVSGATGVSVIGKAAFSGCRKLSSISLSSKLTQIGEKAFYNCASIKKATINSKVVRIGASAFKGCSALKSLTIKTTKLTSQNVGKDAFKGINSKAVIKVPGKKLNDYKKLLKSKGITGKNQKIKK